MGRKSGWHRRGQEDMGEVKGWRRAVMCTGWIKLSLALVPFKCQFLNSVGENILLSQTLSAL